MWSANYAVCRQSLPVIARRFDGPARHLGRGQRLGPEPPSLPCRQLSPGAYSTFVVFPVITPANWCIPADSQHFLVDWIPQRCADWFGSLAHLWPTSVTVIQRSHLNSRSIPDPPVFVINRFGVGKAKFQALNVVTTCIVFGSTQIVIPRSTPVDAFRQYWESLHPSATSTRVQLCLFCTLRILSAILQRVFEVG